MYCMLGVNNLRVFRAIRKIAGQLMSRKIRFMIARSTVTLLHSKQRLVLKDALCWH